MTRQRFIAPFAALLAGVIFIGASISATADEPGPRDDHYPGVIELLVDATDVQRGIFHVQQRIPVREGGVLTLLYPEWIPGNHAPSGPIDKLAGLRIHVAGRPLAWKRDRRDMYAFHVDVPPGAAALDVAFQFISPTDPAQGRIVTSPDLMNLQWNTVVLYPSGYAASQIRVAPRVMLPEGWGYATALQDREQDGSPQAFAAVSLATLVDSPLFAGRHYRRFELAPGADVPVSLHAFGDSPENLEMPPVALEAHRELVHQSFAIFQSWPFERYDFLLCLSDEIGDIGLEHRQSSENCETTDYLTAWSESAGGHALLSHEFVHAWNGKYRRGAGLATAGYEVPVEGDTLWVYEGLTEYLGVVLAARSGLLGRQHALDALARTAATYQLRAGRVWRPLVDTTYAPITVRRRPQAWRNWQRGEDYYSEGLLIWLEVDVRIRRLSRGQRSLDDFIAAFFGDGTPDAAVSPYTLEDIVATLNDVQPYDWENLLQERVYSTTDDAPIGGITEGGYRLAFHETPSEYSQLMDKYHENTNLIHSLGLSVKDDNRVSNVIWGGPAFDAGLTLGSTLIAVNGKVFTKQAIATAIRASHDGTPVELTVQTGNRVRTLLIENAAGPRYPALERNPDQPDLLGTIIAPR